MSLIGLGSSIDVTEEEYVEVDALSGLHVTDPPPPFSQTLYTLIF